MQKNQNVFLFYVRVLLYCLVALLIRAAALAPLAALFVFPADSLWRWLWVVSPLMVVFLVLPLRFSFADALVQRPRTRDFSIDRALSLRQYGEKLAESLRHALSVLKWAIPLAGLGAWGYYLKEQYTVKGLLDGLRELGKNVSGTWYAVVNFFRGLFGHLPLETVEGSYMQGVYTVLALVGLGLLILLYGAVRNSATRYIWAVANHEDRPVGDSSPPAGPPHGAAGHGAVQSTAVCSLPVARRSPVEGYVPGAVPAAGAGHVVERPAADQPRCGQDPAAADTDLLFDLYAPASGAAHPDRHLCRPGTPSHRPPQRTADGGRPYPAQGHRAGLGAGGK